MLQIVKNWLNKRKCKHDYEYLCSGENVMFTYRFYKCKNCGKTKIENFER